jgi:hypothetical protein
VKFLDDVLRLAELTIWGCAVAFAVGCLVRL